MLRQGTLLIETTDSAAAQVEIPLTARLKLCQFAVAPSLLDFGNVEVGTTMTAHVTVSNQGATDCNVQSLGLAAATDRASPCPPSPRASRSRAARARR